jgi:hypothetical protein
MKNQPITEITPEVIAKWKEEHGQVYKLEVAKDATPLDPYILADEIDEAPKYVGYIKVPPVKILNFAMQKLPMFQEAGRVIISNCWLGGDEELKTPGPVLNAASMQVVEMLKVHQARLKEV